MGGEARGCSDAPADVAGQRRPHGGYGMTMTEADGDLRRVEGGGNTRWEGDGSPDLGG